MNLVKVISSELDSLSRRVIKALRYGTKDVRTATQAAPFGIDSNPPKNMMAVFSKTEEAGKSVIVGYINKNLVAASGEVRLFSVNEAGVLQTYVWLKADGQILLGGDTKHLVEFEALKAKWDAHIAEYNLHTHSGNGVPATQQSTSNIDDVKTDNLKIS